jgi:hypothetical protein
MNPVDAALLLCCTKLTTGGDVILNELETLAYLRIKTSSGLGTHIRSCSSMPQQDSLSVCLE